MRDLSLYRPPMEMPEPLLTMIWQRRSDTNPAHRWLRGRISALCGPVDAADEETLHDL